jgi:glutathione S-transferase
MVYCDTEQANSWCDCVACLSNVFTEEGRLRLQEEWENTQWHKYELEVECLAAILPKLRTVEWFFGRAFDSFDLIALPFWRWTIERDPGSSRPRLKRHLFNWRPTHPFSPPKGWTMTLGMKPDLVTESELRKPIEVHDEAMACREYFDPIE